jgi:hypothetical protein
MNDPPETACGDVGTHLQDRWVEADIVVDRKNLARMTRRFADELGGFFWGHCERFFADDVFAGGESGERLRRVFFVG